MKAIFNKLSMTKYLVVLLLLLTGCSEDWLDYEKRGSQIPSTFYKTDDQAFEGLMAAFDQWQASAGWAYLYLHLALSDESYAGGGARGDNSGILEELNEYRFTPATSAIKSHYSWLYYCINRANLVIDNVDPDTDNKTLDVAEAKVLRAYAYFFLVNLWGDVPLVLHELGSDEYMMARTPKAEVWAQIETDLTEAIPDIPTRGDLPTDYAHLISKGAAQSILGKAYLFQEKYSEAAQVFDQVITSSDYDLYPDYSKVLRLESEYGVESVWELPYVTNQGNAFWPNGEAAAAGWWVMMNPRETQFYCPSLNIVWYGWCFLNPHQELYDAYVDAGDNVRLAANFITKAEIDAQGGYFRIAGDATNTVIPYGSDGIVRLRYDMYNDEGEGAYDYARFCNNGTNIRMIRFADVLLMAAEANNRMSPANDTKAQTYLNRVRTRVTLPDVTSTGNALFEAIKLERRLELYSEGQRYLDLQRWQGDNGTSGDAYLALKDQGKSVPSGIPGQPIIQSDAGYKIGKNELLPIPEYEMTVNTAMEQNPGYN